MKKILWFKFGGLEHKILNVVLLVFIAAVGCVLAVSANKSKRLAKIVGTTRVEQQAAIQERSTDTLMKSIETSLTKTNALQAYIADDMFADIKSDVMTLQSLTKGIFENSDMLGESEFELPDPSR
ncbi:MAG: hypothetical protein J5959_15885, partial [Butyrivibrio sp.]|nr:hypothetical protein [Butyrivibrio sp.]